MAAKYYEEHIENRSQTSPLNQANIIGGHNNASALNEALDERITDQISQISLSTSPSTPVISANSSQCRSSDHNELDSPSSPVSSPGLRNRKSASSSDGGHLSLSSNLTPLFDKETKYSENSCENEKKNSDSLPNVASQCLNMDEQPHQQGTIQPPTQQSQDTFLLQSFWRTYDDVIILSLFSIFGIVFRIFSATWFRMELGVVFSEDSALGTNLPLNCCSCFLLGLLCSGR